MYKLDKNIPIPPRTRSGNTKSRIYPFHEMDITTGASKTDSFVVPFGKRASVSACIRSYSKRTGKKFTARTVWNQVTGEKAVRVWRTA